MLHIPILRQGKPYESVEKVQLVHHATGEPVALVSQANSGLIARDLSRWPETILESIPVARLIAMCRKAADVFLNGAVPIGETRQTFDDYVRHLSATTGMPHSYCRSNARKIHKVLDEVDVVLRGLTRGFDLSILDGGYGPHAGGMLSYYREGRTFGAVLPSNSPGVHSLWVPAVALKAPIILKPGREEPWTPLRIIESLAAAGIPRESMGFYPSDHEGAAVVLRRTSRSMLFGDTSTTRPWASDRRVEIHGPGFSKVILGDDAAEHWEKYVELMETSIAANGGRSCINASGVWTPCNGRAIAEALARRLARVEALPADDPAAQLAAFANPTMAERMSEMIDQSLRGGGAVDLTERFRGGPRLVRKHGCTYLLPTIVWCDDREHALANKEFLFPFAAVLECPTAEMPGAIGPTLVASVVTGDQSFARALMACAHVDRLNIGPIPTWQLSWDQPHEGNLFEHLYRQRAFQIESAA